MTPNDIMLSSQINALLSHHQKKFLLQQRGKIQGLKIGIIQRDLGILTPKQNISTKSILPNLPRYFSPGLRKLVEEVVEGA